MTIQLWRRTVRPREERFLQPATGRVSLGGLAIAATYGLVGGTLLGILLGALAGLIFIRRDPENVRVALTFGGLAGAVGGSLSGLIAGGAALLAPGRAGGLLAAGAGLAIGAWCGNWIWADFKAYFPTARPEGIGLGAAAGAIDGVVLAAGVARMKRRWQSLAPATAAAELGPDLPGHPQLRQAVRRAGRTTLALRLAPPILLAAGLLTWNLVSVGLKDWVWYLVLSAVGMAAALPLSLPAAWCYRRRRQRQLAAQLAALPVEHRAAVLLPLARTPTPEAYELTARLLRDLPRAPRELTPALNPPGRGSEPSPAGGEHR